MQRQRFPASWSHEALRGCGLVRVIGVEQAHHDARRAEAALRAVQVDHRLLNRMQRLAVRQVLDGDKLCAVDLAEQQDAGVDGLVSEPAALEARRARPCRRRSRPRRSPPSCPRAFCSSRSQSSSVARGENFSSVTSRPRKRKRSALRTFECDKLIGAPWKLPYDETFGAKTEARRVGAGSLRFRQCATRRPGPALRRLRLAALLAGLACPPRRKLVICLSGAAMETGA